MRDAEVRKLVDRGRAIKEEKDTLDVEFEKIKKVLREEAKARKVGYLLGNDRFCRVSPQTSTECETGVLYDTFNEIGRAHEFWECVKVLVGESKAKLGETLFESISTTKSEAYRKVAFLAKIPKKYLT